MKAIKSAPSYARACGPNHVVGSPRRAIACKASVDRRELLAGGATLSLALQGNLPSYAAPEGSTIYDFSLDMKGEPVSLKKYEGQVLVILNIASEWPLQNVNYPGLRALYDKYKTSGFNLLAVPCNQFGGQAPGTSEEERAWAFRKFGFEFDVYDKIDVNGSNAHPLYKFLKKAQPISSPSTIPSRPNGDIEWNYTKFVIDRNGQAVKRLKPGFDPLEAESDIRLLLAGKAPLPQECILHPGRSVCNVEKLLQA